MNKLQEDYMVKKSTEERILRARRNGELNETEARDLWDTIIDLDYSLDIEAFEYQVYQNNTICNFYEEPWDMFEPVKGYSPQALKFVEVIMPILGVEIRKELKEV